MPPGHGNEGHQPWAPSIKPAVCNCVPAALIPKSPFPEYTGIIGKIFVKASHILLFQIQLGWSIRICQVSLACVIAKY